MIELHEVSHTYSGRPVLSGISCDIPDGAVTGLLGPNGAGKSTLLRIVAGLTVPASGSVTIDGHPFSEISQLGSLLGTFLSSSYLPESMTPLSLVRFTRTLAHLDPGKARDDLAAVGLDQVRRRRISQLSLGMKHRLGVALAMAGDAPNIILDEPINGLDPEAVHAMRVRLRGLAEAGKCVVLSSHHMAELERSVDYVIVIDNGHVVRRGPLSEFLTDSDAATYLETDTMAEVVAVLTHAGFSTAAHHGGLVVQRAEPGQVGRIVFGSGLELSQLRAVTHTLEDSYFASLDQPTPSGTDPSTQIGQIR